MLGVLALQKKKNEEVMWSRNYHQTAVSMWYYHETMWQCNDVEICLLLKYTGPINLSIVGKCTLVNIHDTSWCSSVSMESRLQDEWPVSVPGRGNDRTFSFYHYVQTGSGAHPATYPMGTRNSYPMGKAAKAWSWPLTSTSAPSMFHGTVLS
jgi:hypothetical protein